MKTSDFNYSFPEELIAHEPAEKRDHSRLMVINRQNKTISHKHFYDISDYLSPGDLLVLNDTKVIPANLVGIKEEGGAKVEVLLSKPLEIDRKVFVCLVKPGKRLKVGSKVIFGDGKLTGVVLEKLEGGEQIIEFEAQGDFWDMVHSLGEVPLPPYINPKSETLNSKQIRNPKSEISKRYQTVYAKNDGASAAPTAGLHFTPELLEKIKAKGVNIAYLTLHTGLATFRPVWTENIEEHKMHSEYFEIPKETIESVQKAKRVIAVGTTSVRALESIYNSPPLSPSLSKRGGGLSSALPGGEFKGQSDLFIYPGYKFKIVNAMITNFHWPKSTLIMLVSAFAQGVLADKSAFAGKD
ncbi:MAG: tRNA preQ1(34) S-adenosylmethionine ribosyltransferase-isomerase QueA, partial [Candidatus Margulisiibacteriota bacterium]